MRPQTNGLSPFDRVLSRFMSVSQMSVFDVLLVVEFDGAGLLFVHSCFCLAGCALQKGYGFGTKALCAPPGHMLIDGF